MSQNIVIASTDWSEGDKRSEAGEWVIDRQWWVTLGEFE